MNRFVNNAEFRDLLRDWMLNAAPEIDQQIRRSKEPWGWPMALHGDYVRGLCREHVYFARAAAGQVKIGISRYTSNRISMLNSAREIRLREERFRRECGPVSLVFEVGWCQRFHERALHNLFEDEALGGEWFDGRKISGLGFIAELFLLRREASKRRTAPQASPGALEFAAATVSGAL